MAGPFILPPFSDFQVNRFGIIPKSTPGKFGLITDLSFPPGTSDNDLIPYSEAQVLYAGIPEAVDTLVMLGNGALLAKFDIQCTYGLLPIAANQQSFQGMCWRENVMLIWL